MLDTLRRVFSKEPETLTEAEIRSRIERLEPEPLREARALDDAVAKLRARLETLRVASHDDPYVMRAKERLVDAITGKLAGPFVQKDAQIAACRAAIAELNSLSVADFKRLHAFKETMAAVAAAHKDLDDALAKLMDAYPKSAEGKKKALIELLDDQQTRRSAREAAQRELAELEKAIPFLTGAAEAAERRLAEKDAALTLTREEAHRELDALEQQRAAIRQRVLTECAGLSTSLKRLAHAEPGRFRAVPAYIENPASAFLDDDTNELEAMLLALGAHVPAIEQERIARLAAALPFLAALREEYHAATRTYQEGMDAYASSLEQLERERETCVQDAAQQRQEITNILAKRQKKSAEIAAFDTARQRDRAGIETAAGELLGRPVTLMGEASQQSNPARA